MALGNASNGIIREQEEEEEEEEEENIFAPMRITKLVKLLVVLNECDHIRKLLNKNHLGKVPSKAAKC